MIFQRSHGSANVATMVERKTRYIALYRNEDRRSRRVLGRLAGLLGPMPADARRSVTFDRGLEFLAWCGLTNAIGIDVWFCDPQAPHQKGAVENANGRVRRFCPRRRRSRTWPRTRSRSSARGSAVRHANTSATRPRQRPSPPR